LTRLFYDQVSTTCSCYCVSCWLLTQITITPESSDGSYERDSDILCWIFEDYRKIQRQGLAIEKNMAITTEKLSTRFKIDNEYSLTLLREAGLG
jgi:hypothetical protein